MKLIILLVTVLLVPFITHAKALDTPARALRVKSKIQDAVLSLVGVNGIGITGCDPISGLASLEGNFVHCISIYTESDEALAQVEALYPSGTKIRNVFVTVMQIGPIVPQPRMSGGR